MCRRFLSPIIEKETMFVRWSQRQARKSYLSQATEFTAAIPKGDDAVEVVERDWVSSPGIPEDSLEEPSNGVVVIHPKPEEQRNIERERRELSQKCRQLSRMYFWLSICFRLCGSSLSTSSSIIAILAESLYIGIAVGIVGSALVLCDVAFGWSHLSEAYARLAYRALQAIYSDQLESIQTQAELGVLAADFT